MAQPIQSYAFENEDEVMYYCLCGLKCYSLICSKPFLSLLMALASIWFLSALSGLHRFRAFRLWGSMFDKRAALSRWGAEVLSLTAVSLCNFLSWLFLSTFCSSMKKNTKGFHWLHFMQISINLSSSFQCSDSPSIKYDRTNIIKY